MDFERLGPYEIGTRLGKGGMGSVYRGVNVQTGEPAAIKALAPQLAMSEGFRERFEAEIESLKTLRHAGIVRLYGYGEEGGTLFYAMELVEGYSLEEELKAGRRFDWREVVDIAIQVCKALKHAHDHGIVHRDIKPANILLAENDERVKLADFGIARLFGGTQLTMAGGVLGTADYMSPEQAEGRPVSDRCDQYSLGCVMYALLAGRPPFRANSLPEMLQLQRFAQAEPVRRYAPDTPEQLEYAISQLLMKDPGERFPNALVVARHLEAMRRALSRPFDHSQPMPGDKPEAAGRPADGVPANMAVTRPDEGGGGTTNPAESDFQLSESLDIRLAPDATREAATIDSGAVKTRAAADEPTATGTDHFTAIDPTAGQRAAARLNPSVIAASLGLVLLVGAVGYLVFRLAQPYDADTLYGIIQPEADAPSIDHLRTHSGRIDEFLRRFADDPRADQVARYEEELELDRLERRFATLARGRRGGEPLLAAERLYLDSLRIAETDPETAAEQLRDLITLFDSGAADQSLAEDQQQRIAACVELARRRQQQLEERLAAQVDADREALEARLAAAQALYQSAPAEAEAMCSALVDLYRNKAWAAPMVQQAEALLHEWESHGKGDMAD